MLVSAGALGPYGSSPRLVRGMGRPSPDDTPKSPGQGVLYQVVRDHLETFRAEAARVYERDALPRFIEEEFRGFLRCGFLAGGFPQFHRPRASALRGSYRVSSRSSKTRR